MGRLTTSRSGGGVSGSTLGSLTAAGALSATDAVPVSQDGGNTLVDMAMSAITGASATAAQSVKVATVILTGNVTLDTTQHHRKLLVATTNLTLELPTPWPASFGNLGDGFNCEVLALSGVTVTLDSSIATDTGAQTVAGAALAEIVATSQGDTVFASIQGASSAGASSPTATIAAPPPAPILAGNSTASAAVTVALTGYVAGTPLTSEFLYSINGGSTFAALPSGAAIASVSGSTYTLTFTITGLTAAVYTLQLKDTGNSNQLSNSVSISVEQVTGATGVPGSGAQGTAITGFTCTLVDLTTAWACLNNAATGDETRVSFTSAGAISLTPAAGGTYCIRVYDAASGGNKLYQSATFSVTGAPTITLTQPSSQYWSTAFTIAGAYTGAAPTDVDVQVDGAGSWTTLGGFSASGGAWSATVPNTLITSGSSHTLKVRETNLTTTVSPASSAIAFSAAPAFTITSVTPAAIGIVGSNQTFNITYTGPLGTPTATVDGTAVTVSNITGSGGTGSFTIVGPALQSGSTGPLHTMAAQGTAGSAVTTLFATNKDASPPFNLYWDGNASSGARYINVSFSNVYLGTRSGQLPTASGAFVEDNGSDFNPPGDLTQYSPTNPPIGGCSTSLIVPPGPYPAGSFSGISSSNSNLLYFPQTNNYGGKIGYAFGAGIGTGSPAGSYYIWAVVDGYAIPYSAATFAVT